MKLLIRVGAEAKKYRGTLTIAIISTLLLAAANLTAPRILSNMIGLVSRGLDKQSLDNIIGMALVLLVVYASRIIFRFTANFLAHKAAWSLVKDLRLKTYNKLQSLGISYYHDKQTGDLMSRVITDTDTFELLFAHIIPETVTNFITLAGVTTILLFTNWKLALLTCIPVPFIFYSAGIYVNKVRPNFRIAQKAKGELSAQLQDNFSGMKEVQIFGQEDRATHNVDDKASLVATSLINALRLSSIFHPSVEFLTALGTVIVVGFGGYFAYMGMIKVEDIAAFLLYLSLFYAPITQVAQLLEHSQQAMAGAERVIEILDTENTIEEAPNAVDMPHAEGRIRFENVSFSYDNKTPVLKDISFEAGKGQMIALVGATGVGKSTLTHLITRFYDPTGGKIYLDGTDIKSLTLKSLRENISMVLQDTFLFNGTVEENIAFACLGATHLEVEKAAKIAHIHDDIVAMPENYYTKIGERGIRLSGGQKQRIAIARAVIYDAPVLILDEATASVDVETEALIQSAINSLAGTRTIIAIAHRLSTIRKADMILVFEEGRIVERGKHDELLKNGGVYARMCEIQEESMKKTEGFL